MMNEDNIADLSSGSFSSDDDGISNELPNSANFTRPAPNTGIKDDANLEDKDVPVVDEAQDDGVDPEMMPEGIPNVRLSKAREGEALPKGLLNIGMHEGIMIPTKETQIQGFFVKDPAVLVSQFRQYKFVQEKGSERPTA